MKYNVGDKVRIKSIDWYNKNKGKHGIVICGMMPFCGYMSCRCGTIVTISEILEWGYCIEEDCGENGWTDEMIECKVEEKNKPKFKVGDRIITDTNMKGKIIEVVEEGWYSVEFEPHNGIPQHNVVVPEGSMSLVEEEVGLVDTFSSRWVNEFNLPDGYVFKDENGNVINATKIVLEKKKKEYPKTFEECCGIVGEALKWDNPFRINIDTHPYIKHLDILIESFCKLLICRDAYWKIAGEEMGLGKPWNPDWKNDEQFKYIIICRRGCIIKDTYTAKDVILAFPTEEMRDAFYENFKSEIESCKELL